jgi:hypothetical protein
MMMPAMPTLIQIKEISWFVCTPLLIIPQCLADGIGSEQDTVRVLHHWKFPFPQGVPDVFGEARSQQ